MSNKLFSKLKRNGLKITKIEEFEEKEGWYSSVAGWKLWFEDGTEFRIDIGNEANCCESFGYACTNDDVSSFIGATCWRVVHTDTELGTKELKDDDDNWDDDCGGSLFLTFYTDRGAFQLSVYNYHNGYYGHGASIYVNGEERYSTGL